MRATIKDPDLLKGVNPSNVVGYLLSKGWFKRADVPGKFSVWGHTADDGAEILLPTSISAADFAMRVAETISELEFVEQRSQLDILRDLQNSGFDVIRLAAKSPSTVDGSIRLDEGLQVFENAREMVLASACAAVQPRAVFHSRKPQKATDYLKEARFGQTEVGSFVLTILSPVPPNPRAHDLFGAPEVPFNRIVTRTLIRSVATMVTAAEGAALDGYEMFQSAVKDGVSANLCQAVADILKSNDTAALSLSVSWALNRPQPAAERVIIPQAIRGSLEEAAEIYRSRDTLDGYIIEGPVVKLEREAVTAGRVWILADIEGQTRRVQVSLPPDDYSVAVDAHQNYQPMRIVGNVSKEGRHYVLNNPTKVGKITDEGRDVFSIFD